MKSIKITCPICNESKIKSIPDKVVESVTKDLDDKNTKVPLHIPQDVICEHSFLVILDQDFHVEGYEKIEENKESDEVKNKKSHGNHSRVIHFDEIEDMIHKLDKKSIKNIIDRL